MERSINGRFGLVSAPDCRDGVVLIGFLGNVWPHDLTQAQIEWLKGLYQMPNSTHEIFSVWPDGIEPLYPAAKKNFKNGFILFRKGK